MGPRGQDGCAIVREPSQRGRRLHGKKLQLIVRDCKSLPQEALDKTTELCELDVVALVGNIASGISSQMFHEAFRYGVPVVSPAATRTSITDIGNNCFRVCYTDADQPIALAEFAWRELRLKRIARITDLRQPYSMGISIAFKQAFEKFGGTVDEELTYESGDSTFKEQLDQLKPGYDAILLPGYFNEIGPLGREIRKRGIRVPLLGTDGWDSYN